MSSGKRIEQDIQDPDIKVADDNDPIVTAYAKRIPELRVSGHFDLATYEQQNP